MTSVDLAKAADFVWRNARLLDRHRYSFHFENGPATAVVAALRPYRNDDGGFGHALEPDIRGTASQPVPTEVALHFLHEVGGLHTDATADMVQGACDFFASITTAAGAVPFVLPSVDDHPHAPWWQPDATSNYAMARSLAGLLPAKVAHPWIDKAVEYMWRLVSNPRDPDGGDEILALLDFLDAVDDRERAEPLIGSIGRDAFGRGLIVLDPAATGYVKMPLEVVPRPNHAARRLFADDVLEAHLDALVARQQADGGWPITWEPPSPAAVCEWRAVVTLESLLTLRAWGRLN
jgi:hypothetical protein